MDTLEAPADINPRTVMINDPDTGQKVRRIDWIRRVYSDLNHPLFGDRAGIARKLTEIEGREVVFQTIYSATRHLGGKSSVLKQTRLMQAAKAAPITTNQSRSAHLKRVTSETTIEGTVNLDGTGQADINTGLGFFDHMLTLLAHHSRIDITLHADGDLHVDAHHTVEDCGLLFGQIVANALDDKRGINRYADQLMPMDETLVRVALDISGRPYLVFNVNFPTEKIGTFDSELVAEWFRAFTMKAGLTLHVDLIHGDNAHHIAEACFKGLARVLNQGVARNAHTIDIIPSSKGVL